MFIFRVIKFFERKPIIWSLKTPAKNKILALLVEILPQ